MSQDRLEREIAHGKHLAESGQGQLWYWSTPAGQIRFQRRYAMLTSHITPEMQVLEVGCGPGYFTKMLAQTRARITAIDISPDLLEFARKTVTAENVVFRAENAYQLSYPDNAFDTIIGSSILHHLDIDQALKEFRRVLRPGGWMFFTEPNMLNPQVFLERHVRFIGKMFYTSPDETAFVRWSLKKKLLQYQFTDVRITPFDFLHPLIPPSLIPAVKGLGDLLEKTPLIKDIAGSLYLVARKPA